MPMHPGVVTNDDRDSTRDQVVGRKGDDAVVSPTSTTASIPALVKGVLARLLPIEAIGTADVDISEADYVGDYVPLLTIAPAVSEALTDVVVDLSLNKATTGFHAVQTAADTATFAIESKIDGTNWRGIWSGTAIAAAAAPLVSATGTRINVGTIPAGGAARISVLLSAERADVEIPYRVTYRGGAAPTITPVAAA